MFALDFKNSTPQEIAEQLLAEQAVIERYLDSVSALEAQILAYEQKYGIPSSEVHEAIESGRLRETLEVCNWILDIELFERVRPVGR